MRSFRQPFQLVEDNLVAVSDLLNEGFTLRVVLSLLIVIEVLLHVVHLDHFALHLIDEIIAIVQDGFLCFVTNGLDPTYGALTVKS